MASKKDQGDSPEKEQLKKYKQAARLLKAKLDKLQDENKELRKDRDSDGSRRRSESLIRSSQSSFISEEGEKPPSAQRLPPASARGPGSRVPQSARLPPRRSSFIGDLGDETTQMQMMDGLIAKIEKSLFGDVTEAEGDPADRLAAIVKRLEDEIRTKTELLPEMVKQRDKLVDEIKDIEAAIEEAKANGDQDEVDRLEAQLVEKQDALYAIISEMESLESRKQALDGLSSARDQAGALGEAEGEDRVRTMLSTLDGLKMAEGQLDEEQMNKDLRAKTKGKSVLQYAAKAFENIFNTLVEICRLDIKETFSLTDVTSISVINSKFAKLLIRIKRFMNAQGERAKHDQKKLAGLEKRNNELKADNAKIRQELDQANQALQEQKEQMHKLKKQNKLLAHSAKSNLKRDQKLIEQFKAMCPQMSQHMSERAALPEAVSCFMSQFPITIMNDATRRFEKAFYPVARAVDDLNRRLENALVRCNNTMDEMLNQHTETATSEQALKNLLQGYDKTLKTLFPPSWKIKPTSSQHEIRRGLEYIMRSLEVALHLIPDTSVPQRRTAADFARKIRDSLSTNAASEQEMADTMDQPDGGHFRSKIQEYEEQIVGLNQLMRKVVDNLSDALHISAARQPSPQVVSDLLEAVEKKLKGK